MQKLLKDKKYEILDTVDSTNEYIKDKDLFCVIAKEQSGGKGTNNRKFFSPKGGLYLSVKLPLNLSGNDYLLLTPLIAVITANAVDKVAGVKTQIKWVNDIYLSGKKLAGILCENVIKGNNSSVIIGIGINIKPQNFPRFESNVPTDLESEAGKVIDENCLIAELLNSFNDIEVKLKSKEFLKVYREKFYLKDKKITIDINGEKEAGVCLGVQDNLGLVVSVNGEIKTYINGFIKVEI